MELHEFSLSALCAQLDSKSISARECVGYFAKRIEALNGGLNAFVAADLDSAMDSAAVIDETRAKNRNAGRLGGIPFGVKDLEDARGFVTTRGSALFANGLKSQENSHMVECFVREGAIPIGKTNTPEFGWKSDTDNSVFGPTRNPWNRERSPGGSSGGSAAAIAAGMVPFATGSDGGGSLRIPGSACGISAMKVTLGRIPSISPIPSGWADLAVPGPMARTIRDTAMLLDIVVKPDGRDFRSQGRKWELWHQELEQPRRDFRIAYSPNLGYCEIDPGVERAIGNAIERISDAGFEVTPVGSLFAKDPLADFMKMVGSYFAKMLKPLIGQPDYQLVDPGIRDQVDRALSLSATDFLQCSDTAFFLNRTLYRLFSDFDILICPTTAGFPPLVGGVPTIGGIEVFDWVRLTYPFNMTRSPAATVCAGLSDSGLPVGLQVVGPYLGDLEVLLAAHAFEELLGTFTPGDQLKPASL